MNATTLTASAILSVLFSVPLTGQTAFILNRDPASGLKPGQGAWLPNQLTPAGSSLISPFLSPNLPNYYAASIVATGTPLPPVAHEGDIAIDQEARLVYATDGTSFLSQDAHSVYGVVPTAPTVSLPLPGWGGGALTGLAISSAAGLMYICDGFTCQARSKTHPYPIVAPPFPLPPFPGVPGATGLDYHAATGMLWACNVAGATIEFTTTGTLVSSHPAPPVPGISPVRGIAINTTAGPFALPPLPGQTPGFHVCLTNGDKIFDALPPYGVLSVSTSFETHCRGLAISNDPILMQGRTVGGSLLHKNDPALNPGPGWSYPQIGVTIPTCKFLLASDYLTLDGAPASAPALLLVDLFPLAPLGGGIVIGDDVLWLNPFAGTYFTVGAATDASGHAQIELPLVGLPVGLQVVTQWIVPDAAGYLGFDFTDMLQFRIGLR